jgi:hypothetical protein
MERAYDENSSHIVPLRQQRAADYAALLVEDVEGGGGVGRVHHVHGDLPVTQRLQYALRYPMVALTHANHHNVCARAPARRRTVSVPPKLFTDGRERAPAATHAAAAVWLPPTSLNPEIAIDFVLSVSARVQSQSGEAVSPMRATMIG